jgi:GNAT superfamily N-acetyltransferase
MSPLESVVVRTAVPADAEALTHLHLDCWDDAYTGLVPQEVIDRRRAELDLRVARWAEMLEDSEETLVAESPEGLIGFVMAGPGRDNDVDTELELKALYVRAAHWGDGVGFALFEEAVGDRAAYLWVLAANPRAIAFYERQGFRLDGTEDEQDEGLDVRMVRAGT